MDLSQHTINQVDQEEILAIVQKSGSSFYWGMRLLPTPQRQAMYAVYAFCRILDDIADGDAHKIQLASSPNTGEPNYRCLKFWKQEIANLFSNQQVETSIGRQLLLAVQRYNLCQDDLLDLIRGMEMDVEGPIFAPTWSQLDLYCARVAGAVGQLSVKIFMIEDELGRHLAYHLGRALQLTNILRDIDQDWLLSRFYLPRELLLKYQLNLKTTAPMSDPHFPFVCDEIYHLAMFHFDMAEKHMKLCSIQQKRPMKLMAVMYKNLLIRMKKTGWKNLRQKIRLSKVEKMTMILKQII